MNTIICRCNEILKRSDKSVRLSLRIRLSIVSTENCWDVFVSISGRNSRENPTGTDKLAEVSLKLSKSTSGIIMSGQGIRLYYNNIRSIDFTLPNTLGTHL